MPPHAAPLRPSAWLWLSLKTTAAFPKVLRGFDGATDLRFPGQRTVTSDVIVLRSAPEGVCTWEASGSTLSDRMAGRSRTVSV